MTKLMAAAAVFLTLGTGAAWAQAAPGSTAGVAIDQREANQQKRIEQGIASGQLTGKEAANLERREASIARQEARMRARDGGELTARDRKVLNRRLDNTSAAIHRDKHNNRTQ